MRTRRPTLPAALAATTVTAFLLSACGAQVEPSSGVSDEIATVQRCGEAVEYSIPQRAVVYEGGSADKMFALGLTDHVHGYVMPPANPPVTESPWADDYAQVDFLSDDLLNRELVVNADADFVVAGWNSGFSDSRGITPEILDTLGIQSFMHSESCFNYPGHPEQHAPFDGLYTDLERLGQIFHIEDRAAEVVSEYKERVATVQEQAPQGDPAKVFLYDSGTDKPFTAGSQVPPHDIIRHAGAENIFGDVEARWTEATWEAVVDAEPEIIIILEYQDQPAKEKIEFLTTNPATSELPAVQAENFFVMDYNEAISGPRNIDGLEAFAQYVLDHEAGH